MHDLSLVIVKNDDMPGDFYAKGNFPNTKVFTSAVEALQYLERYPTNVLVTECDMPDMDGAELVAAIRDIDSERNRYTYVIAAGTENVPAALYDHHEAAPDTFVHRDNEPLIRGAVIAGDRLATRLNGLMQRNCELQARCEHLEKSQLIDPVTGLGNRRFAEQRLQDSIRHIESRGGAVCFIALSLENYQKVLDRYDERIASTLVAVISNRVKHLVRPLDAVTYFAPGEFALILVQPIIEQCTAKSYQRIADGVRLKSYKTPAGFLDVEVAMSICATTTETGPPDPDVVIRTAHQNLREAAKRNTIVVEHLTSRL